MILTQACSLGQHVNVLNKGTVHDSRMHVIYTTDYTVK